MTHQISAAAESAREAARQQGGQFGAQVRRDNDAPLSSDELRRVEQANGTVLYVRGDDNMLHNESGPAIIRRDGSREWFIDGLLHRTDGPAVIDGEGRWEFWVDGEQIPEDRFALIYDLPLRERAEHIVDAAYDDDEFGYFNPHQGFGSEPLYNLVTAATEVIDHIYATDGVETSVDFLGEPDGLTTDATVSLRVGADGIDGGITVSLTREVKEFTTDESATGRDQAIATVQQILAYRHELLVKANTLGLIGESDLSETIAP